MTYARRARRNTFAITTGRIRFIFLTLCFLGLWIAYAIAGGVTPPTTQDAITITLLFFYSFYLLNIVYSEYQRKESGSPLALFSISALLYFGLSGILYYDPDFFENINNRDYYEKAIIFMIFFSTTFHFSYLLLRHRFGSQTDRPRRGEIEWVDPNVNLIIIALLVVGWFGRFDLISVGVYLRAGLDNANTIGISIPNIGWWRLLEIMPDLAGWIAWTHYLRKVERETGKHDLVRNFYFALFLLFHNLIYWVPTGQKLMIVQAVLVPFFLRYLVIRQIPKFRYIAIGVLSLALMFPLTHLIRTAQHEYLGEGGIPRGLSQIIDILEWSSKEIQQIDVGENKRTFGRLNAFEAVSGAIRLVDENDFDPRAGRDYYNVLVNLVPRFAWPDKPNVFYGNEFGQWIGVLDLSDIGTSIAATLAGEAYLNFAFFGIGIAALLAVIYFCLYKQITLMKSPESGRLLYVIAIPTILYIDGSFALYMSGLFQFWLFVYILGLVMSLKLPLPRFRLRRSPWQLDQT